MDVSWLLIPLLSLVWFWKDAMAAREQALLFSQRACYEKGLQFLDQTVSLRAIRLRWTAQGLTLWRRFSFEYSLESVDRQLGELEMLGREVSRLDLHLPIWVADSPINAPPVVTLTIPPPSTPRLKGPINGQVIDLDAFRRQRQGSGPAGPAGPT
ncbi:hypothetical protein CCP4SC76_5930002 [Gammaproteobacteria bacterium]